METRSEMIRRKQRENKISFVEGFSFFMVIATGVLLVAIFAGYVNKMFPTG